MLNQKHWLPILLPGLLSAAQNPVLTIPLPPDESQGYIPVLGIVWQGVLSGIPVFAGLFSFQNPANNVQHQSIIPTNSFIIPTAMGLAHLYQVDIKNYDFYKSCLQLKVILVKGAMRLIHPRVILLFLGEILYWLG